jgi:hypothetical protein
MIALGLTDHLEGPRGQNAADVYETVAARTILADELGFEYAWFSEHHAHAHYGHLPAPLQLALHLAGRTRHIQLGTAIICLNLHHPLDIAEQVAVADVLSGGRMAPGFGCGSPRTARMRGMSALQRRSASSARRGRVISVAKLDGIFKSQLTIRYQFRARIWRNARGSLSTASAPPGSLASWASTSCFRISALPSSTDLIEMHIAEPEGKG